MVAQTDLLGYIAEQWGNPGVTLNQLLGDETAYSMMRAVIKPEITRRAVKAWFRKKNREFTSTWRVVILDRVRGKYKVVPAQDKPYLERRATAGEMRVLGLLIETPFPLSTAGILERCTVEDRRSIFGRHAVTVRAVAQWLTAREMVWLRFRPFEEMRHENWFRIISINDTTTYKRYTVTTSTVDPLRHLM